MLEKNRKKVKPDFRIQYKPPQVTYNPIFDKNLQYYFANKHNRSMLRKNKIVSKRDYLLDKEAIKIALNGGELSGKFKLRKKDQLKFNTKTQSNTLTVQNYRIALQKEFLNEDSSQELKKYDTVRSNNRKWASVDYKKDKINSANSVNLRKKSPRKNNTIKINSRKLINSSQHQRNTKKQHFNRLSDTGSKNYTHKQDCGTVQKEDFISYIQKQKQRIKKRKYVLKEQQ